MATLTIDDIHAGDVVRLNDGQLVTVDGITTKYIDRDGEHDGPFVTEARTYAHHPIEDVLEVVERNTRECRYCGGGVTSTNPDVDYCRGCFYSGRSQQEIFAPLIARLNAVSNGREWGVWHTGGGCFCLGTDLIAETSPTAEDAVEFMASDYSVLPETIEGPWMVGAYRWCDGNDFPEYEASNLNAEQLVEHVQRAVAKVDGVAL